MESFADLSASFPILSAFLAIKPHEGIRLDGSSVSACTSPRLARRLKHYCADSSTDEIIANNCQWAEGQIGEPRFQFVYLMLPTPCNQRCEGCFMGQDKSKLPGALSGPYISDSNLQELLEFAVDHGAEAIVYGGGGELFAWEGAFRLIETITSYGLGMVIFTNGTLLSQRDIAQLAAMEVVLIVSLRDTVEAYHNAVVGYPGFRRTLSSIEACLAEGFHLDNRLAAEIPVTRSNERRVLDHFIPVMRTLGIVPLVEEYIQTSTSPEEQHNAHTFRRARAFFREASERDAQLGVQWPPQFGQRILAEPQCRRAQYSFAVFPNGDVLDCPSHFLCYGNMQERPLREIIYSEEFRQAMLGFKLCACSSFFTESDSQIPQDLPDYLEALR